LAARRTSEASAMLDARSRFGFKNAVLLGQFRPNSACSSWLHAFRKALRRFEAGHRRLRLPGRSTRRVPAPSVGRVLRRLNIAQIDRWRARFRCSELPGANSKTGCSKDRLRGILRWYAPGAPLTKVTCPGVSYFSAPRNASIAAIRGSPAIEQSHLPHLPRTQPSKAARSSQHHNMKQKSAAP
jgi:hypothetical protein